MDIKILGSGCCRCKKTYDTVKQVVEDDHIDATIEYVTDIAKILEYDIMSMPPSLLMVKLCSMGKCPQRLK